MKHGLIRVAASAPRIKVADTAYNTKQLISAAKAAAEDGVRVLVFPELCMTAYTANDLLFNETLLSAAERGMTEYCEATAALDLLSFVGVPVRACGKIFNCGAAVCHGKLLGLVPKFSLCNYGEFNDARWFARPTEENIPVTFAGQRTVLGTKQVFVCEEMPSLAVSAELCEDVWSASPISSEHAKAGAFLIVNLCCSDEFMGKSDIRRALTSIQSFKACCAYILSDAYEGESTTDMVFAGNHIICQEGEVLAEKKPFSEGDTLAAVCDLGKVRAKRLRSNTQPIDGYAYPTFSLPLIDTKIEKPPVKNPFIPTGESGCDTVLNIQARGLAERMRHTGAKSLLLGVSGGLDSAMALIAAVHAADIVGMERKQIFALTMPCFGTTARTKGNAEKLAEALGVSFETVDIKNSVRSHLSDIGHKDGTYNAAFENAQARERTQVLMDLANERNGLVVGTGDLSELALGWATFNGDHMSMYGVNASVPKTLIRHVLSVYAARAEKTNPDLCTVLRDIIDTPVSPELLPPENGEIAQETETLIGPYELHDYFLWHTVYCGDSPAKLLRLAQASFADEYDRAFLKKTLQTFLRRFFSQQFKRSCMPDGPKVTQLSLSPRGDFRMPSDASAQIWLKELEEA